MDIAGQCYEFEDSLTPASSNFVVKADDGTVLAYLDTSGNLYLKGEVFESM
jgi:hypothetical protein